MSVEQKFIIVLICLVEQFLLLGTTVWLVGWEQWSPWWFAFTLFLLIPASPSIIINLLETK